MAVVAATRRARVEHTEQTWASLSTSIIDHFGQYLPLIEVIKLMAVSRRYFMSAARLTLPACLGLPRLSMPLFVDIPDMQTEIRETLDDTNKCLTNITFFVDPPRVPDLPSADPLQKIIIFFNLYPRTNSSIVLMALITRAAACRAFSGRVEDTILFLLPQGLTIGADVISAAFIHANLITFKRLLEFVPASVKNGFLDCMFSFLSDFMANPKMGLAEKAEKIMLCIQHGAKPSSELLETISASAPKSASASNEEEETYSFLVISSLVDDCVKRGVRLTPRALVNFTRNFDMLEKDWTGVRETFKAQGGVIDSQFFANLLKDNTSDLETWQLQDLLAFTPEITDACVQAALQSDLAVEPLIPILLEKRGRRFGISDVLTCLREWRPIRKSWVDLNTLIPSVEQLKLLEPAFIAYNAQVISTVEHSPLSFLPRELATWLQGAKT